MFDRFPELDFATSTLDTLAGMLRPHAHLTGVTRPRQVLIRLPTPAHEAHSRHHLTDAQKTLGAGLVPVATSTAATAVLRRTDPTTLAPGRSGRRQTRPGRPGVAALDPRHARGRVDLADLARFLPAPPGR